jgi:hypothetical protein
VRRSFVQRLRVLPLFQKEEHVLCFFLVEQMPQRIDPQKHNKAFFRFLFPGNYSLNKILPTHKSNLEVALASKDGGVAVTVHVWLAALCRKHDDHNHASNRYKSPQEVPGAPAGVVKPSNLHSKAGEKKQNAN